VAVSLTTDPIVSIQTVADAMPNLSDDDKIAFLINAASSRFLDYTGRERINSGTVTEVIDRPPRSMPLVWLRATPVDTDEDITITSLYEGEEQETLSTSDYSLTATTGRLRLPNHSTLGDSWGYQIQVVYTGGWSTVPGAVQQGAMELIRVMRERLEGRAGLQSVAFEGVSQSYEVSSLPQSVADLWQKYRVL